MADTLLSYLAFEKIVRRVSERNHYDGVLVGLDRQGAAFPLIGTDGLTDSVEQIEATCGIEEMLETVRGFRGFMLTNEILDGITTVGELYERICADRGIEPYYPQRAPEAA